jgi:predicted RNase H-like nuclease (RuvC/YqgF family)
MQMMELKAAALEEEAERLRTQLGSAEATISNQLIELQRLHSLKEENKRLATELKEMSQQATELKFKVKSSEDTAKEKDDNRAEDMLIAMKNRLAQLNRERSVRILREKEYVSTIERQMEEKAQLVAALADAEAGNKALMQQLHQLGEQLSEMKIAQSKAAREGTNFREFVQLKKELAQVKDENDQLKKEAAAASKVNKRTSLPAITASSSSNIASMEHKAAGGADRPMPGTRGDLGELTLHQGHQGHQRKLSRSSDESLTEVVLPGAWRKNLGVKS